MSVALKNIKKQLCPIGAQHQYFRTRRCECIFLRLVCKEWHTLRGAHHFLVTLFYRHFAPMGHAGANRVTTYTI